MKSFRSDIDDLVNGDCFLNKRNLWHRRRKFVLGIRFGCILAQVRICGRLGHTRSVGSDNEFRKLSILLGGEGCWCLGVSVCRSCWMSWVG